MSQWEYEAGRKICLENIAKGDFSNHFCGIDPKTKADKKKWQNWAKVELKKVVDKRNED